MVNKSDVHYVYMVKCADGTLYTGYAVDVEKRLKEHNGKSKIAGAKYTQSRRPVKLVYSEAHETRSEAMQREYAVKQLTKLQKTALVKAAVAAKKAA